MAKRKPLEQPDVMVEARQLEAISLECGRCPCRVEAFGDELLMQLQLNVHRLVVVYRVPGLGALDATSLAVHLERWRIGAEHAGWKFGWRDAPLADGSGRRWIETYCYAFAASDFLENEPEQLYWRTDTVQMTRYYMLEAARCGVRLSPRRAGFPV